MVITVGRQYGSGGREIGTMLAKPLGIAYYDDMLLKEAAEESGLCEELFRSFDERPKSFLYSIAMDPYSFSMNHVTPKGSIEQQVYLATYDTIKKLADSGRTMLIVTHEMRLALDIASRIIFMENGSIVETGTPDQFLNHPQQERTKAFLARIRREGGL